MSLIRFDVEISFVRRILYSVCYGQRNLSLPFPLSHPRHSLKKTSHLVDTNRIFFLSFSPSFKKKERNFSTPPFREKLRNRNSLSSNLPSIPPSHRKTRIESIFFAAPPLIDANPCTSKRRIQPRFRARYRGGQTREKRRFTRVRNPHRLSASARKEREARATEKGEREREKEKRFRPTAVATKSGWHWYSGRMANTEAAPDPRPFPSFPTTHSPPLLPLCQPSSPLPANPLRSPLLHTLSLTLLPFRRRATATQTRTFRSNSISNQQPINWFEFGIQSGRLPPDVTLCMPMSLLCPHSLHLSRSLSFSFPFALFLALRPLVLSPRWSNWGFSFFFFENGVRVTAIRWEKRDSMVLSMFQA